MPFKGSGISPDIWLVLCVIAIGGAAGAIARAVAGELWPTHPGAIPWATLLVNSSGCLMIGALMVLVSELWAERAHPLWRPFLGAGVLGGFTTFSAYTAEVRGLATAGAPGLAVVYLVGSLLSCFGAVLLGTAAARRLAGIGRPPQ